MRAIGSNHVDNSARLCHAASTAAMKTTLGHGASTCSYVDWLGADLIVFFGANTPNNQPVTTKYLHEATKARRADRRRQHVSRTGLAALLGAVDRLERAVRHAPGRRLVRRAHGRRPRLPDRRLQGAARERRRAAEWRASIDAFVRDRTRGFEAARDAAGAADWRALAAESGAIGRRHAPLRAAADRAAERRSSCGRWASRSTPRRRHRPRADQRRPARGLVGPPNRGLMPIRGHSGVQGGAEVGCVPESIAATRANWTSAWGFEPPAHQGWTAAEMVDAAARGDDRPLLAWSAATSSRRWPTNRTARRARAALAAHPSGHRLVLGHAGRSRGHRDRPSGRDALRIAGRRHRDVDRAADHLFTGDSRPPRRLRARRVGGVSRRGDARLSRTRATRRVSRCRRRSARTSRAPCRSTRGSSGSRRKAIRCSGADARCSPMDTFATPDGFAHFSREAAARPHAVAPIAFFVSTRRGKQFNSMVQRDVDPLTGAARDAVLISADDAARLGVAMARRSNCVHRTACSRPRVYRADEAGQSGSALARGERAAVGHAPRSGVARTGLQHRSQRRVRIHRARNRSPFLPVLTGHSG